MILLRYLIIGLLTIACFSAFAQEEQAKPSKIERELVIQHRLATATENFTTNDNIFRPKYALGLGTSFRYKIKNKWAIKFDVLLSDKGYKQEISYGFYNMKDPFIPVSMKMNITDVCLGFPVRINYRIIENSSIALDAQAGLLFYMPFFYYERGETVFETKTIPFSRMGFKPTISAYPIGLNGGFVLSKKIKTGQIFTFNLFYERVTRIRIVGLRSVAIGLGTGIRF